MPLIYIWRSLGDRDMKLVCCVCQRTKINGKWLDMRLADRELVSHGYCPDCAAIARVELALMQLRRCPEPEFPPLQSRVA